MSVIWNYSIKGGSEREHSVNSVRYKGVGLTNSRRSRGPS